MKLSDIRKLCDEARLESWNPRFIAAARTLLPLLLDVAEAAIYLESYVNRDYSEWKEPLLQALKALEDHND